MRLINTCNLLLEEIPDSEHPKYAILSHRWRKGEVEFEDMASPEKASRKEGYAKLKAFCELAHAQGHLHAWMDTCCINKSSNTELSEAINSMFRWYADSQVCIAYLDDAGSDKRPMHGSEWFERGWTLQELIAPANLCFYAYDWSRIGTKSQLSSLLSEATSIPQSVLSNTAKPSTCSIAQRMSWMAGRTTERPEDRAYSLIGLFDISLAMIYGEREKAFIRLQEEIIKRSDDESIFAWHQDPSGENRSYSGLLATSPSAFAECQNISKVVGSSEFSLTGVGLTIKVPTMP